eukprot:1158367-Pelagomonas_calceolata.AAC.2
MQVWMCFDKQLNPIDCPGTGKASSALSEEGEADQQLQYPRCEYLIMPPVPGGLVCGDELLSYEGQLKCFVAWPVLDGQS